MKFRTASDLSLILWVIVPIALILALFLGWGMNIYSLTQCDFEAPYRAEVLRMLGVFLAPVGGVLGWLDIGN